MKAKKITPAEKDMTAKLNASGLRQVDVVFWLRSLGYPVTVGVVSRHFNGIGISGQALALYQIMFLLLEGEAVPKPKIIQAFL